MRTVRGTKRPRETAGATRIVSRTKVGEGTYGEVHHLRAEREHATALDMALKTIRVHDKTNDDDDEDHDEDGSESDVEDVYVEAIGLSVLARLEAPSFPAFYGFTHTLDLRRGQHTLCLLMEYAKGPKGYAVELHREPERLRAWLFQLLWSLGVAQIKCGFRHYDISLRNIVEQRVAEPDDCHFLMDKGREHWVLRERQSYPMLVDFGFSTWITMATKPGDEPHPFSVALSSQPSPDLLFWPDGSRRDYASDVWALGCTTLNIVTNGVLAAMRSTLEGALRGGGGDSAPRMVVADEVLALARAFSGHPHVERERAHWITVVFFMHALGHGGLPSLLDIPPGESHILDSLRASSEVDVLLHGLDAQTIPNPFAAGVRDLVNSTSHDYNLLNLLRTMLAWPVTILLRKNALTTHGSDICRTLLTDAYFERFRVRGDNVGDGVGSRPQRWYSIRKWHTPLPLFVTQEATTSNNVKQQKYRHDAQQRWRHGAREIENTVVFTTADADELREFEETAIENIVRRVFKAQQGETLEEIYTLDTARTKRRATTGGAAVTVDDDDADDDDRINLTCYETLDD